MAYFGGVVVELLDVEPGPVEVADDVVPLGVVVVDEVVESAFDAGGVTTVVDEVELGGVVEAGGGTTTVVDDVVGAVSAFGAGVCCWQAASASSTLAATAVEVRRVIRITPSRFGAFGGRCCLIHLAGLVPRSETLPQA